METWHQIWGSFNDMAEISAYKNYLPFYALACIASSLQFWGRREKFFIFLSAPKITDCQQRRLFMHKIFWLKKPSCGWVGQ